MYTIPHSTQPINLSSSGSALGLIALRDELVEQGVPESLLFEGTEIPANWFKVLSPSLSHDQKIAFIRNAQRLAKKPDTALRAGCRQRISDFGLYGFAMMSSPTFGDAVKFAFTHRELAGSVLRISYERQGDTAVFKTHHSQTLGPLLPFVAEFWRSTVTALFSQILGRSFPSKAMFLPYPKPDHGGVYHDVFKCPVHFGSEAMEWHFDASILNEPCPNASKLTSQICSSFCERILASGDGYSQLQREIRLICLGYPNCFPTGNEVAEQLGMSRRTLFRRLKEEGIKYQELQDDIRQSLALEYLEATRMPVEEIAYRVGFSDCSNFRKAFKRWTGKTPTDYRQEALA